MRRLKWSILLLTLFCCLASLFISEPVSAFSFGSAGNFTIGGIDVYTEQGAAWNGASSKVSGLSTENVTISDISTVYTINKIRMYLNGNLPASSIGSFNVNIRANPVSTGSSLSLRYYGFSLDNGQTVLADNCVGTVHTFTNHDSLTCNVVFYNANSTNQILSDGKIIGSNLGSNVSNPVDQTYTVTFSDIMYLQIDNSTLSADDRTFLNNLVYNIDSQINLSRQRLDSILTALNEITDGQNTSLYDILQQQDLNRRRLDTIISLLQSTSGSETDAINNPEYIQQEKEDLEDAKDEAQASADDSGAEAEQQGTTLLQAFSSFVSALTNASPSNCNIDMDMGNLDLGIVNFCQLSPPPIFQTIASIFMILFCVPLSIATARKVIALFRSFQT